MSDNNKPLERALREAEAERDACCSNNNNESNQGPPVYSKKAVITKQPSSRDLNQGRCALPLPISIISNDNQLNSSYIIPYTGVQLLNDVDKISIEQTVELDDLNSVIESENRFMIKGDRGQIMFSGLESSSSLQRLLCGSGRKFIFRIFDRSKQEALFFIRRLACMTPPFGCFLQRLDVFVPSCEYIGCVQQLWTPMLTTFSIRNTNLVEVFRVEGPLACCCSVYKEAEFNVFRTGNSRSVTSISQQWDERLMNYSLTVNFPARISCNYKALLIACGILLEYMYFEISTSGKCTHCFR